MDDHPPPLVDASSIRMRAEIDTSRPFRSVREAVALFGERFLATDIYAIKLQTIATNGTIGNPLPSSSSSSLATCKREKGEGPVLADLVKKLESELEETKQEVKLLKARESETEIAVASLNAELHKNMAKLAEAEAAAARAAATIALAAEEGIEGNGEEKRRDMRAKFGHAPSLAQVLSIDEKEGHYDVGKQDKKQRKRHQKKKPIIPLIGDLFSMKKSSSQGSSSLYNGVYGPSQVCLS